MWFLIHSFISSDSTNLLFKGQVYLSSGAGTTQEAINIWQTCQEIVGVQEPTHHSQVNTSFGLSDTLSKAFMLSPLNSF